MNMSLSLVMAIEKDFSHNCRVMRVEQVHICLEERLRRPARRPSHPALSGKCL